MNRYANVYFCKDVLVLTTGNSLDDVAKAIKSSFDEQTYFNEFLSAEYIGKAINAPA